LPPTLTAAQIVPLEISMYAGRDFASLKTLFGRWNKAL
jgi:hypothetical protein